MHFLRATFSMILEDLFMMEKEWRNLCVFLSIDLPVTRLNNIDCDPIIETYSLCNFKFFTKCFEFRFKRQKDWFYWISIEFKFKIAYIFRISHPLSMLVNILYYFELPAHFLFFESILLEKSKRSLNILKSHRYDMFSNLLLNFLHPKLKSYFRNISFSTPGHIAFSKWVSNRPLSM